MKKTDIAVISFTYRGAELAERIQEAMDAVWFCKLYTKCSDARAEGIGISVDQPLAEWTGKQFAEGNALPVYRGMRDCGQEYRTACKR